MAHAVNNSQASCARNIFACKSSVSISISIQWLLFQNLSRSFFNPSKLLGFITAHEKAPEVKHVLCDKPAPAHLQTCHFLGSLLLCSSWTRRMISFSLTSFSMQALTLQISSMFLLPSPLPIPTSRSSVLIQGLFQTSCTCLVWTLFHQLHKTQEYANIRLNERYLQIQPLQTDQLVAT